MRTAPQIVPGLPKTRVGASECGWGNSLTGITSLTPSLLPPPPPMPQGVEKETKTLINIVKEETAIIGFGYYEDT